MKKIIIYLFILLTSGNIITAQKNNEELLKAKHQIKTFSEVYFEFIVKNKSDIKNLPLFISVDKVEKAKKGYKVYAYIHKKNFKDLLNLKIPFKSLDKFPSTKVFTMATTIEQMQNWDRYPTYDVYIQMMQKFADDYPNISRLETIGNSQDGRLIQVLKITDNPDDDEDEPEFFYTGQMHGDELVDSIMLLRLIDYLLTNYGSDDTVTNLVNNVEIWINPLANPDGLYHGGNNTVDEATRYLKNGVDPNRNFKGISSSHPDENPYAQETIDMMAFATNHNINLSANLHSGAEVVNYPWDSWNSATNAHADDDWWQLVSHEYANTVFNNSSGGYFTGVSQNGIIEGGDWYVVNGGRQDYMTYFQNGREFTLELSESKGLQASELPAHWNYNYHSLLKYMQQSLYGVRGIITDADSGSPIKAKVSISGHDKENSFVYSALPIGDYHRYLYEGTYNIRYSKAGYYPQVINVTVHNNQTTIQNVALVPDGSNISELHNEKYIKIWPNPLKNGKTTIGFKQNLSNVSLSIFENTGKVVFKSHYNKIIKNEKIDLDLSKKLKKGVYFLKIQSNNINFTKILIN